MKFKYQFYGLNKKVKNARTNGFIINQMVKVTTKNYSSPSNINILSYLIFPIPIMHKQFFRTISQKPDYVKTHCNDFYNLFHFACRIWVLYNRSP